MSNFKNSNPKIIAEIGCNHKGDMEIAKEMIVTAATFCKVDTVKFQKRTNSELLTKDQYNAPHINSYNSYGKTYGKHREFLEFTVDQHRQLKEYCEEFGVTYSTSVWDLTAAKEITSLQPKMIKIPSASNLNWKMLDYLINHFAGEIHVSTGMTSKKEIDEIVSFFDKAHRIQDVIIYACTSGYPVAFEDICLYEITYLKEKYDSKVKGVGFSGHHLGIAADIAAMTLGAEWVERHFTLDRTWKGTDHAASLEPGGIRKLARDLRSVHKSLRYKSTDLLEVEIPQRKKLKWIAQV
ncbi:N-acetylneuraminate synthase family protein [Candidatus Babeliales bacterium]|nr:N-acetylneuraminate synthase family protein [Candidatus Babeliales bacterium]